VIRQKLLSSWAFLGVVAVLYLAAGLASPAVVWESLVTFVRIIYTIIPVFLLVFGLMFLTNLFLRARDIAGYVGKASGLRGWAFAIGGGILSTGPIYMWYPLLADLRERGMKNSLVAAFLYNRAVKIPLMPMMILYFGWTFTIVLSVLMVMFSVLNGVIVGRIMEVRE
jgi:uncharacterized membrane protein YraQ (UPF0718 family)